MKPSLWIAVAAVAATLMAVADADAARRLGAGRSIGAQRSVTPPPASAPAATPGAPGAAGAPASSMAPGAASNPVMPPTAAGAATAARPGMAGAAAQPGRSRWLGPIAGLAAGLGLAALASHLGLGAEFGNILLIALVVLVAFALIRLLMSRRAAARSPLQYAGATPQGMAPVSVAERFEPVFGGARAAPAPVSSSGRAFPPGFDAVQFATQAKSQFRQLQAAHDRGDLAALADVTTPELYEQIARDVSATPGAGTDVVKLDADVLDVSTEGDRHWISVRFHGLSREDGEAIAKPFDEVWNLVKPVDGSSGWLLAGIQQMDAATQ
jgi:predicted lipid-binding transport protein (Tim44 family)